MKSSKNIRPGTLNDLTDIETIARQLPQWFTQSGIELIRRDFYFQKSFVYCEDEMPAAFITYYADQGKGHIGWLAVSPNFQKKGIGRKLTRTVSNEFLSKGIDEVFVSTLGDSVDYPPYEKTRSFYRSIGFKDFQRIQHPENPECEEELVLRLSLA